jgi:hypothetical protein
MKQLIEQWLLENTNYSFVNVRGTHIDFLYFNLGLLGVNEKTKEETISRLASEIAAHIENSKPSH